MVGDEVCIIRVVDGDYCEVFIGNCGGYEVVVKLWDIVIRGEE